MDPFFFKSWLKLNKWVPNFQIISREKIPPWLTIKKKSETDLVESPVRFDTWALFVTGFDPAETVKFEDDEVGNFIFLLIKLAIYLYGSILKDVKNLVKWQQDVSNYKISLKCKQSCWVDAVTRFFYSELFKENHATYLPKKITIGRKRVWHQAWN